MSSTVLPIQNGESRARSRNLARAATQFFAVIALGCVLLKSTMAIGCTEIGCTSGFFISVPEHEWRNGDYQFTFLLEKTTQVTCKASLPMKSKIVFGETGIVSPVLPQVTCAGKGVSVSAQCLNSNEICIPNFQFSMDGLPKDVSIEIAWNGKKINRTAISPKYKVHFPNGPKCPPACKSATLELHLKY